jgi:hypothetical protein
VIEKPPPTQTALIVAVPDLERAVAEHRRRLDVAASWGVPAHVTVLYPFVPPDAIDAELIAGLGEALASVEPFDCEFSRSQWFGEDVVWLAPDPDQPFRALTTQCGNGFRSTAGLSMTWCRMSRWEKAAEARLPNFAQPKSRPARICRSGRGSSGYS